MGGYPRTRTAKDVTADQLKTLNTHTQAVGLLNECSEKKVMNADDRMSLFQGWGGTYEWFSELRIKITEKLNEKTNCCDVITDD